MGYFEQKLMKDTKAGFPGKVYKSHYLNITAVYEKGESKPSNGWVYSSSSATPVKEGVSKVDKISFKSKNVNANLVIEFGKQISEHGVFSISTINGKRLYRNENVFGTSLVIPAATVSIAEGAYVMELRNGDAIETQVLIRN